jgi:hypothetical protein
MTAAPMLVSSGQAVCSQAMAFVAMSSHMPCASDSRFLREGPGVTVTSVSCTQHELCSGHQRSAGWQVRVLQPRRGRKPPSKDAQTFSTSAVCWGPHWHGSQAFMFAACGCWDGGGLCVDVEAWSGLYASKGWVLGATTYFSYSEATLFD